MSGLAVCTRQVFQNLLGECHRPEIPASVTFGSWEMESLAESNLPLCVLRIIAVKTIWCVGNAPSGINQSA